MGNERLEIKLGFGEELSSRHGSKVCKLRINRKDGCGRVSFENVCGSESYLATWCATIDLVGIRVCSDRDRWCLQRSISWVYVCAAIEITGVCSDRYRWYTYVQRSIYFGVASTPRNFCRGKRSRRLLVHVSQRYVYVPPYT